MQRADEFVADDSIDLLPYLLHIVAHWRLVLVSTILAGLLSSLLYISPLGPSRYEAQALVAIVRVSTQAEFDPRLRTVEQNQGTTQDTFKARRAALSALASSGVIATQVFEQLSPTLSALEITPSELLRRVRSELVENGDVIAIRVRDRNDPVLAAQIATVWAEAYVRHANELYSGVNDEYVRTVESEYQRAVREYEQAQARLEQFIARSRKEHLQRYIGANAPLLELTASYTPQKALAILNAAIGAQDLAIKQELEGKRNTAEALFGAQYKAYLQGFTTAFQADSERLSALYRVRNRIVQLIGDAEALRAQIEAGGDSVAQSNALALNLMKAQAFALALSPGVDLQLQMPTEPRAVSAAQQRRDVEALIASLNQRLSAVETEIAALEQKLVSGAAYTLTAAPDLSSLYAQVLSETFSSLLKPEYAQQLIASVNITALEPLLQVQGGSARILDELAQKVIGLPTLAELEQSILQAQSDLEREAATLNLLTLERDAKRETLATLTRKREEVNLQRKLASIEVQLASPALPPDEREPSLLSVVVLSSLLGLVLGVIGALVIGVWLEPAVARLREHPSVLARVAYLVLQRAQSIPTVSSAPRVQAQRP